MTSSSPCMLHLLQRPMADHHLCFSNDQLQEMFLQLGGDLSTIKNEAMVLEYINQKFDFQHLITTLTESPATLPFTPSFIFDLQQTLLPPFLPKSWLDNFTNLLSRINYWQNGICVIGIGDRINEKRALDEYQNSDYMIAIRFVESKWACLVIDIHGSMFEYYDPYNRLKVDTETSLFYDHLLRKFPPLKFARIHFDETQNNQASKLPELKIITYFIHRCVYHTLPSLVVAHLDAVTNEETLGQFFTMVKAPHLPHCELQFPNAAYRVARKSFVKLLDHFYIYSTDVVIRDEIREMKIYLSDLQDASQINSVVINIQNRLMDIMPSAIVEYLSRNVWQKILYQLCADPLTAQILTLQSAQARKEFVAMMNVEVHDISFDDPESVYELVYQMREEDSKLLRQGLETSVLRQSYPPLESHLVKPLDLENLTEYETILTRCDAVVEEAIALVQSSIQSMLTTTEKADMTLVRNICVLNENDVKKCKFLRDGLNGWNFPLHTKSKLLEKLEPRFRLYMVNAQEMQRLLDFESFILYMIIRVWIFMLTKHTDQELEIVRESLSGFYGQSYSETTKSIFCALLDIAHFEPPQCDKRLAKKMFANARAIYASLCTV